MTRLFPNDLPMNLRLSVGTACVSAWMDENIPGISKANVVIFMDTPPHTLHSPVRAVAVTLVGGNVVSFGEHTVDGLLLCAAVERAIQRVARDGLKPDTPEEWAEWEKNPPFKTLLAALRRVWVEPLEEEEEPADPE